MELLFDIGATKMRLALAEQGKIFETKKILPTPQNFQEGLKVIQVEAEALLQGRPVAKVAGGIAGRMRPDKTGILKAKKLSGWEGRPLKQKLEEMFKCPAVLENDAAIGALGEAKFGAAQNFKIAAYLTVGTGLGGARVSGGKIDTNAMGFEPGKQLVQWGSSFETLENLISGRALEERYGTPAEHLVDEGVWEAWTKLLAVGLNNTIAYWSPDVIVLGGSVIYSDRADLKRAETYLKEISNLPIYPEIKKAVLGEWSGIFGASLL